MAAIPYIQLYVADYLADTMHLTTEEHGAYLLLIMNYWQTGKPIPKSRLQKIARLPNDRWPAVEESLQEFFEDTGEEWKHGRIDNDLEDVMESQAQKVAAGKASAAARKRQKRADNKQKANDRSAPVDDSLQRNANEKATIEDKDSDEDSYPDVNKKDLGSTSDDDSPERIPPVRDFPLKNGATYQLDEDFVTELTAAYPKLAIEYELRRARLWLMGNAGKRKTKAGMKKFLSGWMGRQKPTAVIHEFKQSRHVGFENKDYSAGLIEGVSDDAANF